MFKSWLKYVMPHVLFGIGFGFVVAHLILLPMFIMVPGSYNPLGIFTGNLFGGGIIVGFLTFVWFRKEYPKLKADKSKIEV